MKECPPSRENHRTKHCLITTPCFDHIRHYNYYFLSKFPFPQTSFFFLQEPSPGKFLGLFFRSTLSASGQPPSGLCPERLFPASIQCPILMPLQVFSRSHCFSCPFHQAFPQCCLPSLNRDSSLMAVPSLYLFLPCSF